MAHILLIEDDPMVSIMVSEGLRRNHHIVECANNGDDGADLLLNHHYDLAVIDWELPGQQGIEICTRYRGSGGKIPVLFLTALTKIDKKVWALDSGADDYLCKPFSFDELNSRVNALLRRPPVEPERFLKFQDLTVDILHGLVSVGDVNIDLTAHEFEILKLLVGSPGRVFTPGQILERVSKSEPAATDHSIRQRVMLLRKKLLHHSESIKTVRNVGYKLED
jgi:DNA-binding response OmpR family regulator